MESQLWAALPSIISGLTLTVLIFFARKAGAVASKPLHAIQQEHEENNKARVETREKLRKIDSKVGSLEKICDSIVATSSEYGERLEADEKHLDSDNRRIATLEDDSKLTLRVLLELVNHEIDGNHVGRMKDLRDELEQYLIKR